MPHDHNFWEDSVLKGIRAAQLIMNGSCILRTYFSKEAQTNWGFISCFIKFYFRQTHTESICATSDIKGFYSKQSLYKTH